MIAKNHEFKNWSNIEIIAGRRHKPLPSVKPIIDHVNTFKLVCFLSHPFVNNLLNRLKKCSGAKKRISILGRVLKNSNKLSKLQQCDPII